MDREIDKKLEEFTGKLLKDLPRESPSLNFTTQVMSRVETLSDKKAIIYKPLIFNKLKMILIVAVVGIFAYLLFGNVTTENSWMSSINLDAVSKWNSLKIPDYEISNIFLYGITGFTFFMGIQIFMLKNHFNKRLA